MYTNFTVCRIMFRNFLWHSFILCLNVADLKCFQCAFFSCVLRFPSTNVKVRFTSLVSDKTPKRVPSPPRTKVLPPLRINIPQSDSNFASPVPSPTGTIRYETFLLLVAVSHFMCVYIPQSINCRGH